MLFLLFQIGTERYALEARQVAEVLPLVNIKRIPMTPPGVAGIINYHGTPAPVLDLNELALGEPAPERLSTRIIMAHYHDRAGTRRLLGLIAGRTTETLRREPADFRPAGITPAGAGYLGPVATDERGLIQWVEIDRLLPDSLQQLLFRDALPLDERA
jgi:chemotaxis-related protein WspB